MSRRSRTVLLALAVLAALSYGAGTASAFEQTLTSLGNVTFASGSGGVACRITMTATFVNWHELPIEGRRAGSINGVAISGCTGGEVEGVLGLPWEMTELRVLGTLPSLTGILVTIRNVAIEFETFLGLINCLYSGAVGLLIPIVELGGGVHSFGLGRLLEATTLGKVSGAAACPLTLTPRGTFRLSPLVPIEII